MLFISNKLLLPVNYFLFTKTDKMNTNKVLLSGFAGGIAYFLLGWLVYGILLKDMMMSKDLPAETLQAVAREPMAMWAMATGCFMYGLLFALIFGRWAGIKTLGTGFTAGALIAFFFSLSMSLMMYAQMKTVSLNVAIMSPFVDAVLGGIVGGVVGWVLGYGEKK